MANGDDATAEGMDLVSGSASRSLGYDEINKTRDYIAQFFNTVKTWATNLFLLKTDAAAAGVATASKLVRYSPTTRITTSYPSADADAANKLYVDNAVAGVDTSNKVSKSGDTMTGDLTISGSGHHLFVPASTAATSGYTNAYINGDGRLSRGASSRRYKKNIRDAAADLFAGILQLRPVTFQWKNLIEKSDHTEVGLIAEEVAEVAPWLAVFDADGQPEAVLYERIGLALIPIVQQQAAQVAALTARLDALDGGTA